MSRLSAYNALVESGRLHPESWAELCVQLSLEESGGDAAARTESLLNHLLAHAGPKPDLAFWSELCLSQNPSPDPVFFSQEPTPVRVPPRWLDAAMAAEEVARFAKQEDPSKVSHGGPGSSSGEGFWRKGKNGDYHFVRHRMVAPDQPGGQPLWASERQKAARPQDPRQEQQRQQVMAGATPMQRLADSVRQTLQKSTDSLKRLTAGAWERLGKSLTPEVEALARQRGVKPEKLIGLPGKTLQAIADPNRQPAHQGAVPLSERHKVTDLSQRAAKNPIPAREPPKPEKVPDKASIKPQTSAARTLEAQQKAHGADMTPLAAGRAKRIRDLVAAGDNGPALHRAIEKQVGTMNYREALAVYRQVVPVAHQGRMPVPASAGQAAAGIVASLRASGKSGVRDDIGARISGSAAGQNLVKTLTGGMGKQHAEARRTEKHLRKDLDEASRQIEKTSAFSFLQKRRLASRIDEAAAGLEKVKELKGKIAKDGRERMARVLESAGPPSTIRRMDSGSDRSLPPKTQEAVKQATEWIGRVLRGGHELKVSFHDIGKERAYAIDSAREDGSTEIHLGRRDGANIAVHEIGHAIEDQIPGAKAAVNEFLKHRCGSEKLKDMSAVGGAAGEMGRKDDFDKHFDQHSAHYVGKHYADKSTEVLAMGLQAMYEDPVGFARNDPEYAALVGGILSGDRSILKGGKA